MKRWKLVIGPTQQLLWFLILIIVSLNGPEVTNQLVSVRSYRSPLIILDLFEDFEGFKVLARRRRIRRFCYRSKETGI